MDTCSCPGREVFLLAYHAILHGQGIGMHAMQMQMQMPKYRRDRCAGVLGQFVENVLGSPLTDDRNKGA